MGSELIVVGGGIGGLTAAIAAAEHGIGVELFESSRRLGGNAWTLDTSFRANWGPHVIYSDGPWWPWLDQRRLATPAGRLPNIPRVVIRLGGRARKVPPPGLVMSLAKLRRMSAPSDATFTDWATGQIGIEHATGIARFMGVVTYDSDPGRLSAQFVHERLIRATQPRPSVRYPIGGWGALISRLADHAKGLGVQITTDHRVDSLPTGTTILAIPMPAAAQLLNDSSLTPTGTTTALLDVVLVGRRPPVIVSDFDEAGWAETFSTPDPSLVPAHHHLIQAQKGMRDGETLEQGVKRIEGLLDQTIPRWRSREVWRRRARVEHASGALDVPGVTWHDRPAINRGNDVYLVNDMVAAPGLLAEVTFNAAIDAVTHITRTDAQRRS
jgi:hypothetical protein